MKKILLPLTVCLLFFAACKDDDMITNPLLDDDDPMVVTPIDTLEDTIELKPPIHIAGDTTNGYLLGVWQDSIQWEGSTLGAICQGWHITHPDDYIVFDFNSYHPISGFLRQVIFLT